MFLFKQAATGDESEAPKQQFMDVEIVPGTKTDQPVVIGASPKLYTIDQFTESDYPEKARYCKDGQHFHLGEDFYVNAGTMSDTSTPMPLCKLIQMWCSTACPCTGAWTSTSRYSSLYVQLDASKAKPDEIVFEDQWDQTLDYKCFSKKTIDDYKILTKKNGVVIGGVKFRQEGFRQKCGRVLEGLDGQAGGDSEQYAWMFQGEEPVGAEKMFIDGEPPKNAFGTYLRTGLPAQKCCECRCNPMDLIRKCLQAACPCAKGMLRKTAAGEYSCHHKFNTWAAKVPGQEGRGVSAVFWQVKEEPAQMATDYKRPVCVMSTDETQALIAMSLMPHPHASQLQYVMGMPGCRNQVLPEEREGYGLGWSVAYQHMWTVNSVDAVELTAANQPTDKKYWPKDVPKPEDDNKDCCAKDIKVEEVGPEYGA